MSLYLQYGIVFLAVAAAGWSAWRLMRGRRVLGRAAKSVDPGNCSSCGSAAENHRQR